MFINIQFSKNSPESMSLLLNRYINCVVVIVCNYLPFFIASCFFYFFPFFLVKTLCYVLFCYLSNLLFFLTSLELTLIHSLSRLLNISLPFHPLSLSLCERVFLSCCNYSFHSKTFLPRSHRIIILITKLILQ